MAHDGSMGLDYGIPTWMDYFYGFHVGKYGSIVPERLLTGRYSFSHHGSVKNGPIGVKETIVTIVLEIHPFSTEP